MSLNQGILAWYLLEKGKRTSWGTSRGTLRWHQGVYQWDLEAGLREAFILWRRQEEEPCPAGLVLITLALTTDLRYLTLTTS